MQDKSSRSSDSSGHRKPGVRPAGRLPVCESCHRGVLPENVALAGPIVCARCWWV